MNDMSSFVDALGDELRARRLPFDAIPVVDMSLMQSGLDPGLWPNIKSAIQQNLIEPLNLSPNMHLSKIGVIDNAKQT